MSPKGDDTARKSLILRKLIQEYQDGFTALEKIPQPVIALIHNACIGGGIDMVTAADIRLCTSDSYFCVKEVDIGLAADVGTLQRLPKVIGNESLVRDLCYTARNMHANEGILKHLYIPTYSYIYIFYLYLYLIL